jgi:CheY-like chemotaxis protein
VSVASRTDYIVVDDDMRNIFAISSLLESYNANVIVGKNGKEGIQKLKNAEVDLILMDIMMPEMDGYEAMKRIRKEKKYEKLPIIALTAKAMKEDRDKCIAAGANDYLSKPVEKDKLLSLLRVWLY